jgi:hypothetical protein
MLNVRISIILILLVVTSVQAQQPAKHQGLSTLPHQAPNADAPAAVCSVHIKGRSKGLSKATVACSTGSITAASDDSTALTLFRQGSRGVKWTAVDSCGLEAGVCLLAICGVGGGGLLDLDLAVSGYVDGTEYLLGVVCIAGNTRVNIKVGCARPAQHYQATLQCAPHPEQTGVVCWWQAWQLHTVLSAFAVASHTNTLLYG